MHPQNPHNGRYQFDALVEACPELAKFQIQNPRGETTIDFGDPSAVTTLNRAPLAHHYGITSWGVPDGYLCPPIPGRVDYVLSLQELIGESDSVEKVRVLDIGTGANCIYPIVGSQLLDWSFVASEIDPKALKNARAIVAANQNLTDKVRFVLQKNASHIFRGVIKSSDRFTFSICNPPFFGSAEEADSENRRKRVNLSRGKSGAKRSSRSGEEGRIRNFGGVSQELWCDGGERGFLQRMIEESREFASQVGWFTSLVSRKENIEPLERTLERAGVAELRQIPMSQGQKISRILAWRFAKDLR